MGGKVRGLPVAKTVVDGRGDHLLASLPSAPWTGLMEALKIARLMYPHPCILIFLDPDRVSTVLNDDTKTYGKQFLLDDRDDTCWNSAAV